MYLSFLWKIQKEYQSLSNFSYNSGKMISRLIKKFSNFYVNEDKTWKRIMVIVKLIKKIVLNFLINNASAFMQSGDSLIVDHTYYKMY